MHKKTQNKLRKLFYTKSKAIFFTNDNLRAANTLISFISSLLGKKR